MSTTMWKELRHLDAGFVQSWTPANLRRCDPRLVWADAATIPGGAEPDIAVLVELKAAGEYDAFSKRMNPGDRSGAAMFVSGGFEPMAQTRFVTGFTTIAGLRALVADVVADRIERFTLQKSRPGKPGTIPLERGPLKPTGAEGQAQSAPAGTYLGIIDDGLPYLRVRDSIEAAGRSAHLWDQGWQASDAVEASVQPALLAEDDPHWQFAWELDSAVATPSSSGGGQARLRGFVYGRRLKPLIRPKGTAPPNDRDEYLRGGYFAPAPRRSHGAGVLGLFAPWLSAARKEVVWPEDISGLAMVQLPTRTVADTSGGSLAMHALDGLRYILWQESRDRSREQASRPIVANVSYGVHAGPHDGSSMFERAVEEALDANPHLHLVLPVGNAAQVGSHARRSLAPSGKAGHESTLTLRVLPDNGNDTLVEIWLPAGAEVAVKIQPPGSEAEFEVREGEARLHFEVAADASARPRTIHFGAVYAQEVAQGTNGTMVLLAIGPTRRMPRPPDPHPEVLAPPGIWKITVRNQKASTVEIDAWIERDDAAPGFAVGSRQAYFPDTCAESTRLDNASPEDTLNGIASLRHARCHVVGAMRRNGGLSAYSAAGGPREISRDGPDVVTVADWSNSVPGLRTIGFVGGAIERIDGTSAACAVYARALARQLALDPTTVPAGSVPPPAPPEITCVPDSQPQANPDLRGQDRRRSFPFEVDL